MGIIAYSVKGVMQDGKNIQPYEKSGVWSLGV